MGFLRLIVQAQPTFGVGIGPSHVKTCRLKTTVSGVVLEFDRVKLRMVSKPVQGRAA